MPQLKKPNEILIMFFCVLMASCATHENPLDKYEQITPATNVELPPIAEELRTEYTKRGRYMVELLGCGACHTDGTLVGEPVEGRLLAGSQTGIAYTNPMEGEWPGVVFPPNLTPDKETGIGNWNQAQLIMMIRHGVDRYGIKQLSVMPWPMYEKISDEDAIAIASYLQSLEPVKNKIPMSVPRGQKTSSPYVHFGIYRSRYMP